jgi:hypothetical protein
MAEITVPQIRRLKVLYSQFARRAIDLNGSREERLRWASEQLGRGIDSFSDLTRDEAKRLIDLCQEALGIEPSKRARQRARKRQIKDENRAHAAGTEGRHDGAAGVRTMATQEDLDRIQNALTRMALYRSAERRGGQRVIELPRYLRKRKRTFEQHMERAI